MFASPIWSPSKSREDSILCLSQLDPPITSKPNHINGCSKVFHDRVHDQITLHPALVAIIDTPQFQRLRDLHQLGNTRYIYTGATNTRFEHSLGTSYLATRMVKCLRSNHEDVGPTLELSEIDILCIGMAGLCHDLGHGPQSHAFEIFVNECRAKKGITKKWEHEESSIEMFDYLIAANNLDLSIYGLQEVDLAFVKMLIHGLKPSQPWPTSLVGRPESKRYLCDIVANQRNGIDVDKMDYFMRDSTSCFGKLPDIHIDRIFNCARVIYCDDQFQVCFQQKVALSLNDLFQLRAKLHKFIYQHRVVLLMDYMTREALHAAEATFRIAVRAPDGSLKEYSLSETVENVVAYSETGDWVFNALQSSVDPALALSREILLRIRQRRLYTLVGMFGVKRSLVNKDVAKQILSLIDPNISSEMPADNLVLLCSVICIGSSGDDRTKLQDPLNHVRFFNPKKEWNAAFKLSEARISPLFVPSCYEERTYFVLSKDERFAGVLYDAIVEWKKNRTKANGDVTEPVPFANPSPGSYSAKKRRTESAATPPRTL